MVKTIIVLGMHRSATSLIAKGLSREINMGGLNMLKVPLFDNPKGHWEDRRFIALNDRILNSAGGSWDNPPDESEIVRAGYAYKDDIRGLIQACEHDSRKKGLWGWKDPRTTLTIRLYAPYLQNPHYVCCFRDPYEVSQSLQRRNRFTLEKGINLTKIYNRRLLSFIAEFAEIGITRNQEGACSSLKK